MTTFIVVDEDDGQPRSEVVARGIRERRGGKRLSVSEVARRLCVTQQKLSRRMAGEVPFDIDELDAICQVADISFTYVTTGIKPQPMGGPDGGGATTASAVGRSSCFIKPG